MALKLKTYEGQAKLSIYLAILGALTAVGALSLILRNFDGATFYVNYNPKSVWLPTLGGTLLLGLAATTIGFFVGLNSAGQRRNKQSGLSWRGFFINALLITIMLSLGLFFYFTRNAIR